jgi:hypothetical protein
MTPLPVSVATFEQLEKRLDERHENTQLTLKGIQSDVGKLTDSVGTLAGNVKTLADSVDNADWGQPPYQYVEPDRKPGDTKEIIRDVSGAVRLIKKWGPAILLLLSMLGFGGTLGTIASTDTDTQENREELQETVRTAAVEAVKEVLKPSP